MQVNKVSNNYTPAFGVKVPTQDLIGFISKTAAPTGNKFATSAEMVTKLTGGKFQGLHTPVMDMWAKCCEVAEQIRQTYPQLKAAAEVVDKYSAKLLKKTISKEAYLDKINSRLKSFEKTFGNYIDITDFE